MFGTLARPTHKAADNLGSRNQTSYRKTTDRLFAGQCLALTIILKDEKYGGVLKCLLPTLVIKGALLPYLLFLYFHYLCLNMKNII